ncbi:CLUMA_CG019498, isoform A [Clunio marinus]|uniref:CLUMA_CG019498, isoform A n=1 Tax=Clunio marinus TaxID=568069 RepID=A0A1J1J4W3_9DIPT|nr:CLUMA_CG019498, isoform A [Clunio marinus]
MWTVNSFMCWELETGGLVIGWFCLILYILTSIILGFVSVGILPLSCKQREEIDENFNYNFSMSICENYSLYLFIVVFVMILCFVFAYFAYLLIKGTKQRKHSLVMPMMILTILAIALELLGLLKVFTLQQLVHRLVNIFVYCYMTLVIYSLYDKFKKEKTQSEVPQYQRNRERSKIKTKFFKMLLLENFLIIFSLEVGGKFIGWFGLITNGIILPLSVLLLVTVAVDRDLSYIREQLDEIDVSVMQSYDDTSIKQFREYLIFSLILIIIISTIYLIASFLLIRGTQNHNHRQIKPAKNILAFLAIFSVFGLLLRFTVKSLVNAVLYAYVFAVVYSLWKKIKEEEEESRRRNSVDQNFHSVVVQPRVQPKTQS